MKVEESGTKISGKIEQENNNSQTVQKEKQESSFCSLLQYSKRIFSPF
jgi:hypothetical protein